MFAKSQVALVALCLLATSEQAFARIRWMERNDKPVFLHPRRFGQEHPAVIDKLSSACPGQVCGNLAGAAITPLLAAQPECSQQDMADQIIGGFPLCVSTRFHSLISEFADAAQQFDDATKANMIALAIEYRQAEKNTPPVSFICAGSSEPCLIIRHCRTSRRTLPQTATRSSVRRRPRMRSSTGSSKLRTPPTTPTSSLTLRPASRSRRATSRTPSPSVPPARLPLAALAARRPLPLPPLLLLLLPLRAPLRTSLWPLAVTTPPTPVRYATFPYDRLQTK